MILKSNTKPIPVSIMNDEIFPTSFKSFSTLVKFNYILLNRY